MKPLMRILCEEMDSLATCASRVDLHHYYEDLTGYAVLWGYGDAMSTFKNCIATIILDYEETL